MDPSLPNVAAASYLVQASAAELEAAMHRTQSHGLFGELKALHDDLMPSVAAIQAKYAEMLAGGEPAESPA